MWPGWLCSGRLRRGRSSWRARALIAFRTLSGAGAAMIMPMTLSIVTSVFPPEERAGAVGVWAWVAGAEAFVSLLVSGALLESPGTGVRLGWQKTPACERLVAMRAGARGGGLPAVSLSGHLRGCRGGAVRYRPKNDACWNCRPARICSTRASDSDPIRSPRRAFSTEETCDTTTTLRFGRFPSPASSRTFPGPLARRRFDVSAHTTTVVMREWLKTSS